MLTGREIKYPRGRVLGGSSTVNYMIYMRGMKLRKIWEWSLSLHFVGSSDDYDLFAEQTGDDGWSWDNMAQYIPKVSAYSRLVL